AGSRSVPAPGPAPDASLRLLTIRIVTPLDDPDRQGFHPVFQAGPLASPPHRHRRTGASRRTYLRVSRASPTPSGTIATPDLDVESLHRDALGIDAHNDTIVSNVRRGLVSLRGGLAPHLADLEGTITTLRDRLSGLELSWHGQVDLEKLRAGGI